MQCTWINLRAVCSDDIIWAVGIESVSGSYRDSSADLCIQMCSRPGITVTRSTSGQSTRLYGRSKQCRTQSSTRSSPAIAVSRVTSLRSAGQRCGTRHATSCRQQWKTYRRSVGHSSTTATTGHRLLSCRLLEKSQQHVRYCWSSWRWSGMLP